MMDPIHFHVWFGKRTCNGSHSVCLCGQRCNFGVGGGLSCSVFLWWNCSDTTQYKHDRAFWCAFLDGAHANPISLVSCNESQGSCRIETSSCSSNDVRRDCKDRDSKVLKKAPWLTFIFQCQCAIKCFLQSCVFQVQCISGIVFMNHGEFTSSSFSNNLSQTTFEAQLAGPMFNAFVQAKVVFFAILLW